MISALNGRFGEGKHNKENKTKLGLVTVNDGGLNRSTQNCYITHLNNSGRLKYKNMKARELFKNKPPMQQRAGVLCSIYAPYLYS